MGMFTVRTHERTRKGPAKIVKPLTHTRKMWGTGFRGTGTGWPGIPQGYLWYSLVSIFSTGNFIVIPMVKLMENPEKIHLCEELVGQIS